MSTHKHPASNFLGRLRAVNLREIGRAGARYSPQVDPASPNLEIETVLNALRAATFDPRSFEPLSELATDIGDAHRRASAALRQIGGIDPLIDELLEHLDAGLPLAPASAGPWLDKLTGLAAKLAEVLENERRRIWSDADSEKEKHRKRSLQAAAQDMSGLAYPVDRLLQYSRSPVGQALVRNTLWLRGEWGVGKTHFLCDIAHHRMEIGRATLFLLAESLPCQTDPLTDICTATGLAHSASELLTVLNALSAPNERSLIIIDGVNESDRSFWRRHLADLAREVAEFPHVQLVVSSRNAFESQVLTDEAASLFVQVDHPGFADQEFDAQQEFFRYYDIPIPDFPLLSVEFSRPLFLGLFCKTASGLSRRHKSKALREVASGQRGMSHVFERFVKEIAKRVQASSGVSSGTCWKLLKGMTGGVGPEAGLAGIMARELREYVTFEECRVVVETFTDLEGDEQDAFIHLLVKEGVLAERVRWDVSHDGEWYQLDVIEFSYQRFSDHVVARHLLDQHLDLSSESTIRRSFYLNRPLGRVFALTAGRSSFAMPGWAQALMIEFPERTKRAPGALGELAFVIPASRRAPGAIRDVFFDGLPWRSTSSFNDETEHLIDYFLNSDHEWTVRRAFASLSELGARPSHPYSAEYLRDRLQRLSMRERDLIWSEFVRNEPANSVIHRFLAWVEGRGGRVTEESAENAILFLSIHLTTTDRHLRDSVTRALARIGRSFPRQLFSQTLRSGRWNDPYIFERMLAASYGAAMNLWADPRGQHIREELPDFARALVADMFHPDSRYRTRHALIRGYALGIIELAQLVDPGVVSADEKHYMAPPFDQLPAPAPPAAILGDDFDEEMEREIEPALQMDFNNYTIGKLIPERSPYNYEHPEYQEVRRQIMWRMRELGYSQRHFGDIDSRVANSQYVGRGAEPGKTDRYGKKYAWIAFFEQYGYRADRGMIPEWRDEHRPTDCDIDPSFPIAPPKSTLPLPDPFSSAPTDLREWLVSGSKPDFSSLLMVDELVGCPSGWLMLDGFLKQKRQDEREIFSFVRGLLVGNAELPRLRRELARAKYPGNDAIPGPLEEYYTFAGEIPWSNRFARDLRDGHGRPVRDVRNAFEKYGASGWRGIPVEVPAVRFAWESYHSSLNQVSGTYAPTPSICEQFDLANHCDTWDLFDSSGERASVLLDVDDKLNDGHFLFLRRDLAEAYAAHHQTTLVWIIWGERSLHHSHFNKSKFAFSDELQQYLHIHKEFVPHVNGPSREQPDGKPHRSSDEIL